MIRGKKGVSLWLSWVLIVAFIVALSVFMFNWMSSFTESQKDKIVRLTDGDECNYISLSIELCQNTQNLYINATNNQDVALDKLIFRVFDIYDDYQTKERNISIKPGEKKKIELLKYGITTRIEIIPVIIKPKDNTEITCQNRMIESTTINNC